MKIKASFEELTDEALDARARLYLRLLLAISPGKVSEQIYARLCEVRLAQFERGHA